MSQSSSTSRNIPKLVYEGYAAEDIEPDSVILKIICPELTPHAALGTIGAGVTKVNSKLTDRDGNPINVPITTANHIVASWENSSNQRYPPMIRKGEPVEVFKVADQDKYQWRTSSRGRDFRKTDRVVFEVGAMPSDGVGGEKSDTNTYSGGLDSVNQKMWLRSSRANGEATAFSCEFDLKAGTFTVSDDSPSPGNRIHLDSGITTGNPTFQVNLSSGTTLKFENENGMITVPKKLLINAGERIVFNSPLTIFNLNQVGAVIVNAANIVLNGAKDVIITGSVFGVNAAASKIGGVLVAAAARITSLKKGSAGSNYSPTTINRAEESPVVPGSNSPDTDMSGVPYD
jgi:hypothetical protein